MVFDVMIKEVEKNAAGKDVYTMCRVHDRELSSFLRSIQNVGDYIVSVIPLFRPKLKDVVLKHTINNMTKEDFEALDRVDMSNENKKKLVHTIPGTKLIFKEQYEYDRLDNLCLEFIDPHGF